MKARDIVIKEVVRQAEFGMEPSWEDFAIAGQQAGIKEVVDYIKSEGDWDTGLFIFGFAIDVDIWNAKLKEWGITLD